jgi:hypothetical protein
MDKKTEKTVKVLVALLEEFKLQKCSYSNVVRGLVEYGWEKYFLSMSEPIEHSRVQFMWMFEERDAYPTEVTIMVHAFQGEMVYCFIKLDDDIYQVAPTGGTSIKKE